MGVRDSANISLRSQRGLLHPSNANLHTHGTTGSSPALHVTPLIHRSKRLSVEQRARESVPMHSKCRLDWPRTLNVLIGIACV